MNSKTSSDPDKANPLTHLSTAIIGGGLSGLTVASQLVRGGQRDIAIFESSDRLGGLIATSHQDGFMIDHGADMFASEPSAAIDLCRDLGIDGDLIQPRTDRRGAMVWSGGRMHPIPRGFVLMRATEMWPVLQTGLLGAAAKLRFAIERFVPRSDPDREQSVAEFVRRRMGNGVLDHLVTPLVAGIYTADIERLSMSAAMGPIAKMEQEHGSLFAAARHRRAAGLDGVEKQSAGARYGNFRSFADGMGGFVRRIEQSLPPSVIQLQSPVQALEINDSTDSLDPPDSPDPPGPSARWRLTIGGRASPVLADRVVIAAPPSPTSKIVAQLDPELSASLSGIESASAAIICLGLHRDQIARPIDAFGFVVPPIERSPLIAGSFASHKFDGRAPDQHVLIRCFVGGVLNPGLVERDDQSLVDLVIGELTKMIGLTGSPVTQKVVRWRSAMPQYNLGHDGRIERIRALLDRHHHLHWTSNAAGGVGIAPTIASARRLANQICQSTTANGLQ